MVYHAITMTLSVTTVYVKKKKLWLTIAYYGFTRVHYSLLQLHDAVVVAFCPLGFFLAPKFRLVASSVILVNRFFHRYTLKFISIVLSMAKVSTMVFARWKHLFSLETNELVALNSPMVAPPFEKNKISRRWDATRT